MSNTLISKMDKSILTNVEGPVFVNYKDPSKPALKSMLFYGYYIRYFDFKYGQMFVVSDLLAQYCKRNNNPRIAFNDYLKTNSAKSIIKILTEELNVVKSPHLINVQNNVLTYSVRGIMEIIDYLDEYRIGIKTKTRIICEDLLNTFLIWLDPEFAFKVSRFLKHCRQLYFQNNLNIYKTSIKQLTDDTKELHREIERLDNDNKALTLRCNTALNRSVKNVSKESFCSYIYVRGFIYNEFESKVIISHGFRNQLQLPANIRKTALVLINNMPSGHQYRNQIKSKILDVLEDYDGDEYIANDESMTLVSKDRSNMFYNNTFTIPVDKYTKFTMIILDIDGHYKGRHPSIDFKISIPNNELVLDFIDMSNDLVITDHWNEAFIKSYTDLHQ